MVPESPPVTKSPIPSCATSLSGFDVPEVLLSQVVPSEDVRRIPPGPPTVTNILFPWVTSQRFSDVGEVLEVHEVPFDEVRIVPE